MSNIRVRPKRVSKPDDNSVTVSSWACHAAMLDCSRPEMVPARQTKNAIMKIKSIICSTVALGLLAGGISACSSTKGSEKEEQAKLEAMAKVSRADAEKIAQAKVPNGTIKEAEIEKEKGKLIWSFDMATLGTKDITEVNVDAITGEVVGVEKESAAAEEKEKKEGKD